MPKEDIILRAERLRRKGRLSEAADAYRESLRRRPRDTEARRRLAEVFVRQGDKDGAISEYVRVQEILASGGDILGAISAGVKVIEIDPRFTNPLSYVAKVQTDSLREERKRQAETVPFRSVKPLTEIALLSELQPAELSAVAKRMRTHKKEEDETVFSEGDAGDSLFFVTRGLVVVSSGTQKLGRLGPGECFGEFSFLTQQPRTASVRTLEATELLELSATDMRSVVESHPRLGQVLYDMYRERALVNVLARCPLFEMLGVRDRDRIKSSVELVVRPAGTPIFEKGEAGGAVYLIKRGTVEVRAEAPNGQEVTLATLGPHQFFGEVSFLTGVPRTATIVPLTPCELLRVRDSELRRLAQDYPALKKVLESYHLDRVMATAETFKRFLRRDRVEGILH